MTEHLLNPITYVGIIFAVLGGASVVGRKKLQWKLSATQFFLGAAFMLAMGVVAAMSASNLPPH